MKSIIEYLNDLKEKTGSDYRTAKELEISKEAISKIRKRGQMSDTTAIKIAHYLNINETDVLISATIARSKGDVKAAWEKISKMSGITASFFIISQSLSYFDTIKNTVQCILCKIRNYLYNNGINHA